MLPDLDLLEAHYDSWEFEQIVNAAKMLQHITDEGERNLRGRKFVETLWPDEKERIQKTSWIQTKDSKVALLEFNYAQEAFWNDVIVRCREEQRPIRGIILKARQLGFSTMIQALQNFWCDTHPRRNSMTISYDDDSTEEIFGKVKLMQQMTWFPRKKQRDRGQTVHFSPPHNSLFKAVTAGNENVGRGMFFQHIHCSEIPMWPDPETSLTSVEQCLSDYLWTTEFKESTARGAQGVFYDEWNAAVAGENDFVPFFAPWFWDPNYARTFPSKDHRNRFAGAMSGPDRAYQERYGLTVEQMAWREWVIRNKLQGNSMTFRQEYPACAEEAFLTTGSPVFDPETVLKLSQNATDPLWLGDLILARS